MTKTILPTRNETWGLWGTCRHNGYDQPMTWAAVSEVLAGVFKLTPEETRDLLDAPFGRHLGDDLSFIPGGPASREAIENYIMARVADCRWRGWVEKAVRDVRSA